MSRAALPNLELLEYQAEMAVRNSSESWAKIRKHYEKRVSHIKPGRGVMQLSLTCEVFPQVWGSTCTAFDVTPGGEPTIGGDAMTSAYTTVFHEEISDSYVVFVGGRLCYMVEDPTEKFLKDLKNKNLASLSEAKKKY